MSIAVLMATYNGETYLEAQIESLVKQSYQDFTVYVHDDGSKDRTVQILEKYVEQYPEKFILLRYAALKSAKKNFFSLLKEVEADYYMFCDQDDIWLPDKIEKSFQLLKETEKVKQNRPCLVFTDLRVVDKKLDTLSESFMDSWKIDPERYEFNNLLRSNIAPGCTMVFNRKCRDMAIQIKSISNFEMHDHLMILLAKLCGEVKYLNQRTILYRQHENNELGAIKRSKNEWIKEKVSNLLNGTQLSSSYKTIDSERKVINELCAFPDVVPEYEEMMKDLKNLEYMDKIERMKIFHKYKLLKRNWKDRWKIILV